MILFHPKFHYIFCIPPRRENGFWHFYIMISGMPFTKLRLDHHFNTHKGAFTVPNARDLFPFVILEYGLNTLTTFLISLMVWSDFMFSVPFRRHLCLCCNNFCCSCQNLLNLTFYIRDKESTCLQKCTGWNRDLEPRSRLRWWLI